MNTRYDAIVIGSGFGGAIAAARLAEHGARVLVLERGRRWTVDQYPRRLGDAWFFNHRRPHKRNGWFDVRMFPRMVVVQGAGVGGGSLSYSSVMLEAAPELFDGRWPPEITAAELRPYYERVARMLRIRPVPANQQTSRARLLRGAAERLGAADRLMPVPLAITFDDDWSYDVDEPLSAKHSKPHLNEQGVRQGTCVHLGNCDTGCDVQAKNSLDLNYIPLAERHGADVRPLHVVRDIRPADGHYEVAVDRIAGGRTARAVERGDRVIVAAGSLGTTELLLRCRDEHRSLPNLSARLGTRWSANGNFLTPDRYADASRVRQGIGPTISAALDFSDGSVGNQRFYVEDDGFPNVLGNALRSRRSLAWLFAGRTTRSLDEVNPTGRMMVWIGMGHDAADGELRLARRRLAPWATDLFLRWPAESNRALMQAIVRTHSSLSAAAGGRVRVPLYWRLRGGSVSVHPLGGCPMGRTAADGVVDHAGGVFGYPGLFVCDGAIVPTAIGRNPSLTIAAIAERIADLMVTR